jgi:hypothetical protein
MRYSVTRILDKEALSVVLWMLPLWCFLLPPAFATDLTVTNVEITQAIQTTTNTIELVTQRGTAVRATLADLEASWPPVSGVTGRLHVFVNGAEITPAAGVPPVNAPLTVPAAPQRANENDTLNFELPSASGITASADVDFRVDITPATGETNTANNSVAADNLTFIDRTTPSIFFTRVNYVPSGLGLPNLADLQPGVGDVFVRGIYPVNDSDPNLYRQGLFPTLTFNQDAGTVGTIDGTDVDNLLSLLASCRQLIVDAGLGANNRTFLYGWIAGNPINGNGWGQQPGFNAFGNTQHTRHQRTFAHELGHNFGLPHPDSATLDQVGWDVGARLVNNPPGNNTTGRVKGVNLFDIMVGGQLTNSAWVNTTTYNFFLGSSIVSSPDVLVAAAGGPEAVGGAEEELAELDAAISRTVVVQGIFDPEGERLVYLKPVFRFPLRRRSRMMPGP